MQAMIWTRVFDMFCDRCTVHDVCVLVNHRPVLPTERRRQYDLTFLRVYIFHYSTVNEANMIIMDFGKLRIRDSFVVN